MSNVGSGRITKDGFLEEDFGETRQLIREARNERARLNAIVHARRNEMRIYAAFGGIVIAACLAALGTVVVNDFGHYHAFSNDAQTGVTVFSIFIGIITVFTTLTGMLQANANLGTALGVQASLGRNIADPEEVVAALSRGNRP